jgi:hypothetical protein
MRSREPIIRWEKIYLENERLVWMAATQCAKRAADEYVSRGKKTLLDLGCTGGKDYRIWSGVFLKPKC